MRYDERKPEGPFLHCIHPRLLEDRVHVSLVGCGGNGSQMLTGLARLHMALRALGHPGLFVAVFDGDAVSPANVGRQLFSPADVGRNKATVLVHRLNSFFGLDWYAEPEHWGRVKRDANTGILISCVDTRAARSMIANVLDPSGGGMFSGRHGTPFYWMDLGNRAADGQVILGVPPINRKHRRMWGRLPTFTDLFPGETSGRAANRLDRADRAPSCSLAEALGRQELFINQLVASQALQLLWQLFRHGQTDYHGVFVNAASGRITPLRCDLAAWARFGYTPRPKTARSKEGRL